jgi:DNA (cytosine-5)-methyltransferase 1
MAELVFGTMQGARLSSLEICAGAGGQALGLERAGFEHETLIELDPAPCRTIRLNRPSWRIVERDLRSVNGEDYRGIDLIAGGVPCPPFSVAGQQRGARDERDLFPAALELVCSARPRAIMLENVPGFAGARFAGYRRLIGYRLSRLGYLVSWTILNASSYSVPQLRPRFILVALRSRDSHRFFWPDPHTHVITVGQALGDLMAERGWPHAHTWAEHANQVGPTLVGGSKLHGGPDLGPSRARRAWDALGVDGRGLAEAAPDRDFPEGARPRLTLRMAARLQGFPDDWRFNGCKTIAYRQIGNALPPPVAYAMGLALRKCLAGRAHL